MCNVSSHPWYEFNCFIKPTAAEILKGLSEFERETLKSVYKFLYPLIDFNDVLFQESFTQSSEVCIAGSCYGSKIKNVRSSYILAFWAKRFGQISNYDEQDLQPRPGMVNFFFKHSFIHNDRCYEHWLAQCEWFYPVADGIKNKFGKPVEVWHRRLFEQYGPASYIPAFRILSKFVFTPYKYQSKDLMALVPRISHSL